MRTLSTIGRFAGWMLVWWAGVSVVQADTLPLHGRSQPERSWFDRLELSDRDRQWLRSRRVLRVAVSRPDYAPFDLSANGGTYEGISADYIGLLAELLGLEVEVQAYPSRELAVAALKTGEAQVLGTASRREALRHGLMLSRTYVQDRPVLAKRLEAQPDSGAPNPLRVALVRDHIQASQVRERFPEAQLQFHPTPLNAMAAVAYEQADVFVGGALAVFYQADGSQLPALQLQSVSGIDGNAFGLAVDMRERRLLQLLDKALAVVSDNARATILRRWSVERLDVAEPGSLALTRTQAQWLAGRTELRVLMDPRFVPVSYRDDQGRFAGVSADVLQQIARRTGLAINVIEATSLAQMSEMIERGEADLIAAMIPSPERETRLAFTRGFLSSSAVLVTREGAQAPRSLAQLGTKRVVLVEGSEMQAWMQQHHPSITVLGATSAAQALAMVDGSQAEAAVLPLIAARYMIARQYRDRLRIRTALPLAPVHFAFAVAPQAQVLQSILDSALLDIPPPHMSELTRHWRTEMIVTDGLWQRYRWAIMQGFAVALLLLLLALGWVSYLQRLIRQRRYAEQALVTQMEFMRVMIDGTPHPIYIRDRQACLINCNTSYLQALGLAREAILNKPLTGYGLLDEAQARLAQDTYLQVMERGEPVVEDRTLTLHSGEVLTINHWMLPYRGADGQIQGLIAGWVDITERQRLCEAYRDAQAQAEAANEAKTTFLATMSHEIRTPMNAVLGMLELALKKAEQGMLDMPALEVASQSANGLLALIGDILDVTRIEAGRLELLAAPCQLGQLATETVGLFQAQARDKYLRLKLEMRGAPDTWLSVDPVRFKQIIANVLSNAIKFTREGQVTVVLGVWPQGSGARVDLSVEDTGQGISQSELARLGAPYRQAAGGRGSRVGAGLGLSICRSLADLMGGQLHVQSALGYGTRVQLQFESVPGAIAPGQAEHKPASAAMPALQVLVVDDYPANRVLLERQLTFLGHRVPVAEHGAAGLRAWLRGAYDVVISDCNMPGINGYQLVKAVREHERRKHLEPCLFLGCTANAQIQERRRCLQQGMDDCLFKPLSLESLALCLGPQRARRTSSGQADEVDLGSLDQLTGGDPRLLKRLLHDLAESNLQDLKRLQALPQPYATGEVADLVHRIKGGARIVRARRLLAACEALEQACTASPSPERMCRGVEDLAAAMSSLDDYLDRYEKSGES